MQIKIKQLLYKYPEREYFLLTLSYEKGHAQFTFQRAIIYKKVFI